MRGRGSRRPCSYTDWIGRMQDADKEIVARSLASVGMEAYAHRTMDKMSDGECQRIMIARALAQQTPVILLDEPTSFLDLPNRYELCSLLARRTTRASASCSPPRTRHRPVARRQHRTYRPAAATLSPDGGDGPQRPYRAALQQRRRAVRSCQRNSKSKYIKFCSYNT